MRCIKLFSVTAAFCLLFAHGANPASTAYAAALKEYEVKAAFLYQFTKFVEWPADSFTGQDFGICVVGKNPFDPGIWNQLAGQPVGSRKIRLQTLRTPLGASGCHVVFISGSESGRIRPVLAQLQNPGTLTVSEIPGFIDMGGIINFVSQGKNIRFRINQQEAEKKGIKISSKLLSLAERVKN